MKFAHTMKKTTLMNKIINKPARILARRGNLQLSKKLTSPTFEAKFNSDEISLINDLINNSEKLDFLLPDAQPSDQKYDYLIKFPYSYFGPQNRRSRLTEQKTLLTFLEQLIVLLSELGYRAILVTDEAKQSQLEKIDSQFIISYHTHGKKLNTIHYKAADVPNFVVFDLGGYSGWSTLSAINAGTFTKISTKVASDWFRSFQENITRNNISKYQQPEINASHLERKKYIFVALQVYDDSTQTLANISMLRMLDIIVEKYYGTEFLIVVKRHPLCRNSAIQEKIHHYTKYGKIITDNSSIHLLIKHSAAVFTVNSGVGSEALMYFKPVYTFGECDYQSAAIPIRSEEQFFKMPLEPKKQLSDIDIIKFLYFYRNNYLIDLSNKDSLRKKFNSINPFLKANVA